ncbi:MAG: hypothetical protein KJ066_14905 [Acidobacteria bacterium]|nr:hypothetical protein [Acidobacteriota bacterium]
MLVPRGTVAIDAGRLGDVVLVERDPLADIANTRSIRWVVVRGRVVHGPEAAGETTRP